MKPQWHFNERRACDRMRDSANDAFFTAESLENLSEALVREGIQNSLDAAQRGGASERQVTVRIALVTGATEHARSALLALFQPARVHFERGLGNGNFADLLNGDIGFLVFEDFGTKGLNGDVSEWQLERADNNAFLSFFRAEGRSSKTGDNLGRWGIGKQVFPTASRLHSMFGLSVRSDTPTKVLMGSAVVRSHSVAGKDFQPDGWFGCRANESEQVLPVTESDFIQQFEQTLGLKRQDKPGLSVVVPCVDDRLSMEDLRRAVVRNFFWPVLLGELVVELEEPGHSHRIDAESIAVHRSVLQPSEAAVVEFAAWAAYAKPAEIVKLSEEVAKQPDWRKSGELLLSDAKLSEIRARMETSQKVGVRIPVRVRPKDGRPEAMSHFTVFIAPCRDAGHRPLFLRDGILIKDVRAPQLQGCRSLVEVADPPLAGLLGDAEGVNHTQWQKDSPKFHNRYFHGPDTIKFVTRSVFEIMQALHARDTKGEPTLLLDLFYLPTDDGPVEPSKKPKPGEDAKQSEPPGGVLPKPKRFELRQVEGGFLLKPGNAPPESFPVRVRIEAAYAVRRGNAIKRWASDDFIFTRQPLRQEPKANGVVVTREEDNSLELELRKPDFQFGVCGFDKKRDLVVRAIELKGGDEENI
jgi:hypothetical protein